VVRAPGTGESLRACVDDIAALTGAKAFTRDSKVTLDDVTIAELGQAGFIAVDRNSTQIIGGGGTKIEIDAHRKRLRGEVEAASGWDRERAENRVARFEAALPPDNGLAITDRDGLAPWPRR
jgi:chaperonin GroEL